MKVEVMPKTKNINIKSKSIEAFLLNSLSEKYLARVLYISVKTLAIWRSFGLPYFEIINSEGKRTTYFNWQDVCKWLDAPCKSDKKKTNQDMLWERTPKHLLPQSVTLVKDIGDSLAGDYWLVPVE